MTCAGDRFLAVACGSLGPSGLGRGLVPGSEAPEGAGESDFPLQRLLHLRRQMLAPVLRGFASAVITFLISAARL